LSGAAHRTAGRHQPHQPTAGGSSCGACSPPVSLSALLIISPGSTWRTVCKCFSCSSWTIITACRALHVTCLTKRVGYYIMEGSCSGISSKTTSSSRGGRGAAQAPRPWDRENGQLQLVRDEKVTDRSREGSWHGLYIRHINIGENLKVRGYAICIHKQATGDV
jgi:hypothetical protein